MAHDRSYTTTLDAALRRHCLTAPCVFDSAINGVRSLAYVEQALARTLRPGDIVVLDNRGAHQGKGVREAAAPGSSTSRLQPGSGPD